MVTVVRAADFVVDSYDDVTDLTPGDGLCRTRLETCTLRAAVQEANALAGPQSIALATGVYLLNPPVTGPAPTVEPSPDDNAVDGDLDITDDVAIYGLSAQDTVIHGNNYDRVVQVIGDVRVTLEDLLLTGGTPMAPFQPGGQGGGLYNDGGTVTLRRVTVIGNRAGNGAGLFNAAGSLLIDQSTVMGNTATESGGGMANQAEMTVRNSTVNGNRAANGGGILGSAGVVRLENVTVTDNGGHRIRRRHRRTGRNGRGGQHHRGGQQWQACRPRAAPPSAQTGTTFQIDKLDDCSILGTTGSNIVGEPAALEAATVNAAGTYAQLPQPDSRLYRRGRLSPGRGSAL
ncbi:MAG: hypothetical protein R2851_02175 [Caldilineaceae bacterium]